MWGKSAKYMSIIIFVSRLWMQMGWVLGDCKRDDLDSFAPYFMVFQKGWAGWASISGGRNQVELRININFRAFWLRWWRHSTNLALFRMLCRRTNFSAPKCDSAAAPKKGPETEGIASSMVWQLLSSDNSSPCWASKKSQESIYTFYHTFPNLRNGFYRNRFASTWRPWEVARITWTPRRASFFPSLSSCWKPCRSSTPSRPGGPSEVGKKGMAILALWPYNIQHTHIYIHTQIYIIISYMQFYPQKTMNIVISKSCPWCMLQVFGFPLILVLMGFNAPKLRGATWELYAAGITLKSPLWMNHWTNHRK